MRHCFSLAKKAEALGEVPVGSIVVIPNDTEGELLGEGWNQPISSSDPSAHAEIMALRDAARKIDNYRLSGAILYTTIEPCIMCAGALIHARIKQLVFGAREPKAGAICSQIKLLDSAYGNHRVEWIEGVLATEARAIITHFFKDKRKVNDRATD